MSRPRRVLDLLTGSVFTVVALLAGLVAFPTRPIALLALAGAALIVLVAFWALKSEAEASEPTRSLAPPSYAVYEPNGGPGPLPFRPLGQRKDDDETDDSSRTR